VVRVVPVTVPSSLGVSVFTLLLPELVAGVDVDAGVDEFGVGAGVDAVACAGAGTGVATFAVTDVLVPATVPSEMETNGRSF
jgi:hypothetical protein